MASYRQSGAFVVARGDYRNTAAIYTYLDNWILLQGYTPIKDSLLVEVYDRPGTYEVEVWLPVAT